MKDLQLNREASLLTSISTGDQKAFTELFDTYYPSVATYTYNIVRSFPLTQEIVQDIFMKIWTSREVLEEVTNFKAYLWVMAKNHALNALVKVAKERTNQATYLRETSSDHDPDEAEDKYYNLIDEAVASLPPYQQKVYLLSRRQRMKQADIAVSLNITVPTVKKYLQLANEAIKSYVLQRIGMMISPLVAFFINK